MIKVDIRKRLKFIYYILSEIMNSIVIKIMIRNYLSQVTIIGAGILNRKAPIFVSEMHLIPEKIGLIH